MATNDTLTSGDSSTFPRSTWGDFFLSYASDTVVVESKEHEDRKMEVKRAIIEADRAKPWHCLELVNEIINIGVLYHFHNEIADLLATVHSHYNRSVLQTLDLVDIHVVSLGFRILRQHGYNVPCDVFKRFYDDESGSFDESLKGDVRGLVSLFEAAHLAFHGDDILDVAKEFSGSRLREIVADNENHPMHEEIAAVLLLPFQKCPRLMRAHKFISLYRSETSRDKSLVKFAISDFNLNQKIYRKHLGEAYRWWKEQDYRKKVPYARDRIIESFFWALMACSLPQNSKAQVCLTDAVFLTTFVDDMYDNCGSYEDLLLFTDAFEKWEDADLESLPEYTRGCFELVMATFGKLEETLAADGRSSFIPSAKQAVKMLVKSYMLEVSLVQQGWSPSVEEYLDVAMISSTYPFLMNQLCVIENDQEDLQWLSKHPTCAKAVYKLFRLLNDRRSNEREQGKFHIASIYECYVAEYGVSEQEAAHRVGDLINSCWKDINEGGLSPSSVPPNVYPFIMRFARVGEGAYARHESFTYPGVWGHTLVTNIIIDPISSIS